MNIIIAQIHSTQTVGLCNILHTHTHTHTQIYAFHKSNICQLTVEWETGQNHMSMNDNKCNRHDTRIEECSTIQFTSVKQ